MHICADIDRLRDLLPLLHEQRRQAKRLKELCRDQCSVAQLDPTVDAAFFQRQVQFLEEQEMCVFRRIELLDRLSEKLMRQAEKAENQLAEALHQMHAVSEDVYL